MGKTPSHVGSHGKSGEAETVFMVSGEKLFG